MARFGAAQQENIVPEIRILADILSGFLAVPMPVRLRRFPRIRRKSAIPGILCFLSGKCLWLLLSFAFLSELRLEILRMWAKKNADAGKAEFGRFRTRAIHLGRSKKRYFSIFAFLSRLHLKILRMWAKENADAGKAEFRR